MTALLKKNKKPLVFIVEDNKAYRLLIGKVLERRGFMVMMFEHGRKAVDMLHYVQPSIIVSDIAMPCMDGFEFHQYVKQHFSKLDIPFVYLSSTSSAVEIKKATELGARSMLGKPIAADELAQTLDSILSEQADIPL
jgi:CheY-like chemotaxis protein